MWADGWLTIVGSRATVLPGSLIAAGTSICGVTAVSALAPAIAATQAEVSVAVANVVLFGTAGMLLLPHVANHLLGHCSEAAGLFLVRPLLFFVNHTPGGRFACPRPSS